MTNEDRPVAATADHLTLALRRSGVLGQGRVSDVVVEREIKKTRSHILRLRLSYDGDGRAAPSSLILKTGRRVEGGQARTSAGRREVAFYREVASGMSVRAMPRYFEALWNDTGEWSLLLEVMAMRSISFELSRLPRVWLVSNAFGSTSAAEGLYLNAGWEPVERFEQNGKPAVLMRRDLGSAMQIRNQCVPDLTRG